MEKDYLEEYDANEFERPSITVDNLLFALEEIETRDIRKLNEKSLQILLVKRDKTPFLNLWSIPGTFVGMNETLEGASLRCLNEKTHLIDIYLEQLYTFDSIHRDPRTRVLSISYMGLINKKKTAIKTTSDNISWFAIKRVGEEVTFTDEKNQILKMKDLAFDHGKIISYALNRIANKLEYTDIAFSLLGDEFTLAELQQVYEIILNKKFTKANFQRKIKDRVECLNHYKTGGFRPALLYKYKTK